MPLAPLFSLQFYGPACGAMVATAGGSVAADIKGQTRIAAGLAGVGGFVDADATRLVNSPATMSGVATVSGSMLARARIAATIRIGANPTAFDVASEVFDVQQADGYTLRQALRVMLAALAGDIEDAGGTSRVIRAIHDDSRTRIAATVPNSKERDVTAIDAAI